MSSSTVSVWRAGRPVGRGAAGAIILGLLAAGGCSAPGDGVSVSSAAADPAPADTAAAAPAPTAAHSPAPFELTDGEFTRASEMFFNHCAGCHGILRAGATGPAIGPERAKQLGMTGIEVLLNYGTGGGMPAFGRAGLMDAEDRTLMAAYLHQPPPEPPPFQLDRIRETWKLIVPPADRPDAPETKRDWQNYTGVILRDAGQVAILDGDTKELVELIDTGFAVHILRSSSSGRYFYAVGRDGRVSMIDLWSETPSLVAQVRGCIDARSVDASKAHGYEDKLVVEGCYWPAQYAVFDGQTLEPKAVVDVTTPAYDTGEPLEEVRVASLVAAEKSPIWVLSLKESGHVAIVDYSEPGFPIVAKIAAERFLHDGGWDHTKRYFMVAANMRDQMVVVDVENRSLVSKFRTGVRPHPGRGANWEDPEYGWVNATTHMGEGRLAVYGADPENHPEHAWKVVRDIPLPAAGGLFLKTHPSSPWVWFDSPMASDPAATRQICVYSKAQAEVERCWAVSEHGRVVHFDYDRHGNEVWVSVWDRQGEIVVYDDRTLEEKTRISGEWLVTPTGKFNVFNTAQDVY